jgi:predicted nucleic acid-binding protein
MIVVADTSPLNYLILLNQISLLPDLYGRILIPHAVHDELLDAGAPEVVRSWARNPPEWLELLSPSVIPDQISRTLDPGEAEAIALAQELHADWLLIDEADGRDEAARLGLRPVGTLGILRNAHRAEMTDFSIEAKRLQEIGFFVSDDLIAKLIASL